MLRQAERAWQRTVRDKPSPTALMTTSLATVGISTSAACSSQRGGAPVGGAVSPSY